MTAGLVLEGGGMRGLYTAGVLDVFMEHGVEFAHAVGVSAGAAFGVNIKSRQVGRAIRYNKRFCADPRYASLKNLLRTGELYSIDFAYREVPLHLDPFDIEAAAANPMRFTAVARISSRARPSIATSNAVMAMTSIGFGHPPRCPGSRDPSSSIAASASTAASPTRSQRHGWSRRGTTETWSFSHSPRDS